MMCAASRIARDLGFMALVTGESIAQVSDILVLRPSAASDKQQIINIARDIGTEEFSRHTRVLCCHYKKSHQLQLARDESRFDYSVLEASINTVEIQLITELIDDISVHSGEVVIVDHIDPTAIIIDIRHPHEVEQKLLAGNDLTATVLMIPFYALSTR